MVVFFSFTVFFAMILSDAGYAMMLGAVLLFDVAEARAYSPRRPYEKPIPQRWSWRRSATA